MPVDALEPDDQSETLPLTLEIDCTCRVCDYNLRGLSSSGICPECGDNIAKSLRVQRYWGANPIWMKKLAKGVDKAIWAAALFIVTPFVGCFFAAMSSATRLGEIVAGVFLVAWFVLLWFLASAGVWQITARENEGLTANDYPWLRLSARVGISLTPGIYITLLAISIATNSPPFVDEIFGLIVLLLWGMLGIGQIAFSLVLIRLARRIRDRYLAAYAKAMIWIVCCGFACITALLVPIIGIPSDLMPIDDGWVYVLIRASFTTPWRTRSPRSNWPVLVR